MPKIVTPKPKVYTDNDLLVTPHGQQFKVEDLPEQFSRGQCMTLREWKNKHRVTEDAEKAELDKQLSALGRLHDQGVLTDDEFAAAKRRLIDGPEPAGKAASKAANKSAAGD